MEGGGVFSMTNVWFFSMNYTYVSKGATQFLVRKYIHITKKGYLLVYIKNVIKTENLTKYETCKNNL